MCLTPFISENFENMSFECGRTMYILTDIDKKMTGFGFNLFCIQLWWVSICLLLLCVRC